MIFARKFRTFGFNLSAAITLLILGMASVFVTDNTAQAKASNGQRATIVLVHGAFAGSSSWNGVVQRLVAKGYPVIAVANPLRSIKGDAAYVASLIKSIPGPVVLVGHSYAGSVISNAADGLSNVKGTRVRHGVCGRRRRVAFQVGRAVSGRHARASDRACRSASRWQQGSVHR